MLVHQRLLAFGPRPWKSLKLGPPVPRWRSPSWSAAASDETWRLYGFGSWPTYRSYNWFIPLCIKWKGGVEEIPRGMLVHVLSKKKKLDLGNLRDTWGRSRTFPLSFLEHATASTAICDIGGALDGLGDMRSIIKTSKYCKVLQPSSTILWNGQWMSMSGCLLPKVDSYFKSRRNQTQRTGSCCVDMCLQSSPIVVVG